MAGLFMFEATGRFAGSPSITGPVRQFYRAGPLGGRPGENLKKYFSAFS